MYCINKISNTTKPGINKSIEIKITEQIAKVIVDKINVKYPAFPLNNSLKETMLDLLPLAHLTY